MSGSMKVNAGKDAQFEYLRRQLEQSMRKNHKEPQSSRSTSRSHSMEEEESESNPFCHKWRRWGYRANKKAWRQAILHGLQGGDPIVWRPTKPGQALGLDEHRGKGVWVQGHPDDKKVKLVSLKLRRNASIWWNNVLSKRARKGKVRFWHGEKRKRNLKPNSFLLTISKIITPNSIILAKSVRVWKSIPLSLRS